MPARLQNRFISNTQAKEVFAFLIAMPSKPGWQACPAAESCSAPRCPLDKVNHKQLKGEQKCRYL